MSNILKAIKTIVDNPMPNLVNYYENKNRINSVGDALECFVKDIFADTVLETDKSNRLEKYNQVFSYIGNSNNPPDLILKNDDAIEVKKIESLKAGIALNSFYPKSKLYVDSPLLTSQCRQCEDWQEKDIIYAIGVTPTKNLKLLWLIYGDCYAADREIYKRVTDKIINGVLEIKDVEFSETRELGRVNRVDPLGITYLRIRGMWGIKNPLTVYDYLNFEDNISENAQVIAIMKKSKYMDFPLQDRQAIENIFKDNFKIIDVKIQSPNNPASLIEAKVINYKINDSFV
ncbi:MAG: NgoPII family restriction endonuclease [Kastovskya adunca ATA6-11-RM4]|jgi:hypothetical protein|nr:NgoPII family restriction endonuclease [Kastovskya adunca ATA6-11-RM4]